MKPEEPDPEAPRLEKPGYNKLVPAVEQAARILFCLAKRTNSRLSLTEICREVEIHKSKGYSILNTLLEFGLVSKNRGTRTYSLGPGLLSLSRSVLDNMELKDLVLPYLEVLSHETGSSALLGLISGERLVIVAKCEASADIGITIRVGHRYPLSWGAHGKAIVSFLPDEQKRHVLEREGLWFYGKSAAPKADVPGVDEELKEIKRLGYALDLGQVQPGINAVSSPVFGSGQNPVGGVIVVGTFPAAQADSFGQRAAAAAGRISSFLGPTIEGVYGLKELGPAAPSNGLKAAQLSEKPRLRRKK